MSIGIIKIASASKISGVEIYDMLWYKHTLYFRLEDWKQIR